MPTKPKPKSKNRNKPTCSLSLPEDVLDFAKNEARRRCQSLSGFIEYILREERSRMNTAQEVASTRSPFSHVRNA